MKLLETAEHQRRAKKLLGIIAAVVPLLSVAVDISLCVVIPLALDV